MKSIKEQVEYLRDFVVDEKNALFDRLIQERTDYVTVVLEDLFQSHNQSAVMRSADCYGIQHVHLIENRNSYDMTSTVSQGARDWLSIHRHKELENNTQATIDQLRAEGYRILATTPHANDIFVDDIDLEKGKMAFFFGTELTGLSDLVIGQADEFVKIPMYGFTESLNVSVCAAITMYSVTRRLRGSGIDWHLSDRAKDEILFKWYKNAIKASGEILERFKNRNRKLRGMKWFWILGVLLGAGGPVRAQMDSVVICLEKIKTATEDSVRLEYAGEIEYFIRSSAFGSYRTEKPVKYLVYKRSDDAGIELFSWAVPLREGQAFYNLFRFKNPERSYLIKALPGDRMAWLFYDFVPFEHQKQGYVLLLGWSKTRNTNRKAVWVACFHPDGTVTYNHPLLRKGESRSASLTFEYALDASMLLKQDKNGKRILFDHLAPTDPKYEGYFMFYGPDASCDALVLKKEEWWYEENLTN